MEKLFNAVGIFAAVLGGAVSFALGAFDDMIRVLIAVMLLDYATGIIKGIYNRELSSYIGWRGVLKKCATLCVVAVANMSQQLLGNNAAIRDIVIMFYIANEALSVLENVAAVSTVIPEQLREVLLQLRESKTE